MKNEYVRSLRRQLLLLVLNSFLLAQGAVLLLLGIAVVVMSVNSGTFGILTMPFQALISMLYYTVTPIPVILLTDLILFVIFLLMLSSKRMNLLAQIMVTVKQMSQGKFDVSLPVDIKDGLPKNEMNMLAADINQMGNQLEASIEEERKAVQAKNELITNVSHDLRTPLTSVIGYLRLIDEDRYKDEVDLRYYVSIAYDKSKRLERMVNDLFEYTRVSYGGLALHRTEINIVQLLGQLSAQFSPQLEEANMDMKLSFSKESILVKADGDKIMRVFENLIQNAIKYGADGKRVEIRGEEKRGEAVIEIVNYGSRIPAADLPHLFNRFYRVEKSRAEHTGGTGLGLAITKSIVELHRGQVSVKSNEFETNFEVRLPLSKPKPQLEIKEIQQE
ncbi:sensor histidine kinase [Bacillus horti]|uniref:histidine kinase n=1 Tax=Caldalkalibacillus horti TaxID=77523 RepID=A0ABT9VY37_9BACI|nr:HAMP domain-containing sensor histidine kinase [Bacillus horti]MDQ0165884.1 signal transduction histidine kinase [Bacillus horti]